MDSTKQVLEDKLTYSLNCCVFGQEQVAELCQPRQPQRLGCNALRQSTQTLASKQDKAIQCTSEGQSRQSRRFKACWDYSHKHGTTISAVVADSLLTQSKPQNPIPLTKN